MINSVSSWLASPIIGVLNLASGFTCDVNKHINNINIALEAYTNCISSEPHEVINLQFNYAGHYVYVKGSKYHPQLDQANYATADIIDIKGNDVVITVSFYYNPNPLQCTDNALNTSACLGSGGTVMTHISADDSPLQSQYICTINQNDLNNLANSSSVMWAPQANNCIQSSYFDVTNALNLFSECLANNNYNGFATILHGIMATLDPYINAYCDDETLQCVQDYANSVFL